MCVVGSRCTELALLVREAGASRTFGHGSYFLVSSYVSELIQRIPRFLFNFYDVGTTSKSVHFSFITLKYISFGQLFLKFSDGQEFF